MTEIEDIAEMVDDVRALVDQMQADHDEAERRYHDQMDQFVTRANTLEVPGR